MGAQDLYRFFRKIVPVLSAVFWCSHLEGQYANISFEHFTDKEGLSAPVNHIVQDKLGFLWFGTTDGLNRFDGVNFIVYRNVPGDTTSIPNNLINALHVDQQGRVWAATNGGVCYYDFTDDRFHTIRFNDTIEKLDQHRVHGVSSGPDNMIWFATRTRIHQWSESPPYKSIALPPIRDLLIKYLYIDSKNRKWIGSNAGMHVYHEATGKFIHSKINSPFSAKNKLEVTVHPIIPYRDDTLFIGTWYADLQKVYLAGDKIISIPFTDPDETDPRSHIVSGIAHGAGSQWWIGTYGNGLAWFDAETRNFTQHFHHNPSDEKSLSDDYINDVFTDASGIVWIGTNKGLDKFDPLTQQFSSVSIPLPPNQFAVYRMANTIVEDKMDPEWLWLCVSGVGIYHYHKPSMKFDLYQVTDLKTSSTPSSNIYAFYYDVKGRVWIGTRAGIYFFDPVTKKFNTPDLPALRNIPGVHTILQDKTSTYWFGTNSNGVYRYDEKQHKVTNYAADAKNINSIPDNKVFSILIDSDQKIWIGTQNRGLCRLDPVTDKFIFFENQKSDMTSLPDNGVYDLYEDQNRQLWISTENGFAQMDLTSQKITNYTTLDGLCNSTVFSITADHQGHLWLGTNNGFSVFNPTSKQFRNYYTNDGLPINRIAGEVAFGSDNTLYFGTPGMLSFCKPEDMKMNKRIPPVLITDFSILGKKVGMRREGDMFEPIHLRPKENMITFHFAALNFTNSFLNQFAYKMEGFDADWIHCGQQQSATYTNLNGGNYVFHVKAANNDGMWNETGTRALIFVHPPFWRTWWFYLLCTLGIAAILYTIYQVRIRQIMHLQNIRTRIARDLHDDIGSTLSSINMISSMADKSITEKKSTELFSTISKASNQAMELMSDIVWSINPKNDRMEMIIIRMRQYASEILEAANISFTLDVDDSSRSIVLPLEMRKDFYLVFKEAVNNLAKYSKAQHVTIRLTSLHGVIHLNIADNGKGFNTKENFSGNGLKNMKARAAMLKGTLLITSVPGRGTIIDLKVPVTP
ncbi:MAG: two-component regulator propeller domain-containing protein [Saprospiraceae bacterium]